MSTLPALCAELKLRADGAVALVNSRDVAEAFEKRHDHVLRDIKDLEISPDLGRSWFRETTSLDSYGREQPSVDMTRQGFTLLVMGWNGERAMSFKVRYIEAFDAMEAALREPQSSAVTTEQLLQSISHSMREIVGPLAVRFDGQDRVIESIVTKVDTLGRDVAFLRANVTDRRRNLTAETKRQHIRDVIALGGRCPCCGVAQIVNEGQKMPFAEFDHFYSNSHPKPEATWPICRPCHTELTTGRVARSDREAVFRAYQSQRERLSGRQATLF